MNSVLNISGLALEVLGLALAFAGAWQTWGDMAEEGEWPWSVATRFVRLRGARLKAVLVSRIRRWLGKRQDVVVGVGAAELRVGAGRGRGRVAYGPLPDEIAAALDELDRRTRELREKLSDEAEAREDAEERLDTAMAAVGEQAADDLQELRRVVRETTVAGLRLQFLGFPIVLLGLVLRGVATL